MMPIAPSLVYELTTVAEPALSPDGTLLAFARSRVDRTAMAPRAQLMLIALPDGAVRAFTSGPEDAMPKFSPDGAVIAFLRPGANDQRQVWLIAVDGGEARQLTHAPGGVAGFAWAPDASRIAVVADVDPDRLPPGHDARKDPRVKVVRRVKYRADTLGWRGDAHRHLFVVDVADGESVQVTDGDWDDHTPAWSPDGERIAFISYRGADRDFVPYSEAYVVAAVGGTPQRWSGGLWSVGALAWSPDGRMLAAVASDDAMLGSPWHAALFMLQDGRTPRRLTPDDLRPAAGVLPLTPPPEMRWTADGCIVFAADARGESFLCDVTVTTGEVRRVAGGGAAYTAMALDGAGRRAVVVAATPRSAGDLHLVDVRSGVARQLTAENAAYFAEHPAAAMEKFVVARAGWEIECRLLLPPGFDAARRYPLVLDIHGGPHGVFYDAFNATQQVLATAGYLVLLVNPRGSGTYGGDFAKAVLADWGGEDFKDILAALDAVCARPYVDASRLGVHGYSYGGYMTSWAVGHDTRFKAAVVGAPCIDLASMYGTSDIGVSFGEPQWGGKRHEAEAAFRERSPITYAHTVRTPVLLLHGEADHRCPIEQSEQYFVLLKRLGKDVEFVRFPGCAHSFLRQGHPRMREEYLARTLAWFDAHLGCAGADGGRGATTVGAEPARR